MAVHAPLVTFLTIAVLLTDDRGQTWTRLSELLLGLAGLPWSLVIGSALAYSPLLAPSWVPPDWTLDVVLIASAWVNVVVVAVLTRRGVRARPLLEGLVMLVAGVGIWAALLSWAPQARYTVVPSVIAALAVLATVFVVSTRRSPVLAGALVGGGAYAAICAHVALNTAMGLFLFIPLAVLGGGAVVLAARAGSRHGRRRPSSTSR